MLLDLGLPDVDGLQLLAMLRAVSEVPVVVVTARDDEASIVQALDAGADDYVVKPFGVDHAAARIRAVLRRGRTSDRAAPLVVGQLVVDPRTRTAQLAGRDLDLARKEFDLLLALAGRAGEVVTKRDLLIEVWQQPTAGRTAPSTYTCPGCVASSVSLPPSRATCDVRGVGLQLVDPEQLRRGSCARGSRGWWRQRRQQ